MLDVAWTTSLARLSVHFFYCFTQVPILCFLLRAGWVACFYELMLSISENKHVRYQTDNFGFAIDAARPAGYKYLIMTPLVISISGVRGIVGESLGPEEAIRFGLAFGTFLNRRRTNNQPQVCIGRDSRPSGPMICAALNAGLMASGCETIDLGIVTTPGVAVMTSRRAYDGGVIITASHNSAAWNGIKLLRPNGVALPAEQVEIIHRLYDDQEFDIQDAQTIGSTKRDRLVGAIHIDTVLQICDRNLIRSRRFRVVLDSINGAGCLVAADLLSELACQFVHLNNQPTGIFAHRPEPIAENLKDLGPEVLKHSAAVGFAQDPDADRLVVVDEKGNFIGEEYTLALIAKYIFSKKTGTAATNLSTSRMIDDIAAAAGGSVIRTPVGEANVANAMIENDCIIGGEGNGGVIDLRVAPVRNSLVSITLILQFLAETGKTISQLVAEIPRYHMLKAKFPCPSEKIQAALTAVNKHYASNPEAKIDTRDGVHVTLPDGWIHLRASNTEPIIRIIAESPDAQRSQNLINEIEALAQI